MGQHILKDGFDDRLSLKDSPIETTKKRALTQANF